MWFYHAQKALSMIFLKKNLKNQCTEYQPEYRCKILWCTVHDGYYGSYCSADPCTAGDRPAERCRSCSNPPSRVRLKMPGKTKTSVISTLVLLVGAGGFEPPKLKAADLQSVPIGHSGTRPYSLFVSFAGRLVYSIMQKGFCQLFFYLFLQMRFPCRETAGKALQPCRHGKVGEKKPAGRNW